MELRSANYRVLIVDDEAIQRTGLLHLCDWSEYGIEIVGQASNGREALECIENASPHVVLTDIVMPIMDGVELTKTIRSRYPDMKVVVLSSYSEFEYVREVFKYGVTDYLLKPKVSAPELIALIRDLCGDIDPAAGGRQSESQDASLLLARWLEDDLPTEEQDGLHGRLEALFPAPFYRVAKAGTGIVTSRTKWTQSQLEQTLIRIAADRLAELRHRCVFLKNEMLLIVNYGIEQSDEIENALMRFAVEAQNELSYISFVVSGRCDGLEAVKAKQDRLTDCLGKLLYFAGSAIVPEERIVEGNGDLSFDQAGFLEKLQLLSFDEAIGMLKALISEVRQNQTCDEYSLKRFMQNLIYSALSTLEQMKMPTKELHSSKLKLFKTIDLAFDIRELESIATEFLESLKRLDRRGDHSQSALLQQIYDYVEHHYANDISLSDMAASLHVNYSYLSSYFKQRTNENLTSYINRVRVAEAKKLLVGHERTISEISRSTGFSDHNYFSKVFKKYTGLTPVEYRNQIHL
ncbi:response regulator transcription factor [Paenibacillus thailandensis]|uniref:Response regulator n=1 Tax=Paenibacillus thailandensis TaxID=393250 RepID=A0ABW5R480_9BACL